MISREMDERIQRQDSWQKQGEHPAAFATCDTRGAGKPLLIRSFAPGRPGAASTCDGITCGMAIPATAAPRRKSRRFIRLPPLLGLIRRCLRAMGPSVLSLATRDPDDVYGPCGGRSSRREPVQVGFGLPRRDLWSFGPQVNPRAGYAGSKKGRIHGVSSVTRQGPWRSRTPRPRSLYLWRPEKGRIFEHPSKQGPFEPLEAELSQTTPSAALCPPALCGGEPHRVR